MKEFSTQLLAILALVAGTTFTPVQAQEIGYSCFTNCYSLSLWNGVTGFLNGENGFLLTGNERGEDFGSATASAGDINGDGFSDALIGAPFRNQGATTNAGRAYILLGGNAYSATQKVNQIFVNNRITVTGIGSHENLGHSATGLGDFNGDGFDDVAIGAPQPLSANGRVLVIFGGTNLLSGYTASTLNGTNGFVVTGAATGDRLGISVGNAGDLNGDGLMDLIIGAEEADPAGMNAAGKAYVIFGTLSPPATLSVTSLNGTNGITLTGEDASDEAGHAVSGGADFNGDGYDDIAVGAPFAPNINGNGRTYIYFGKETHAATISLASLTGTNGFYLEGGFFNFLGTDVALADVTGDGLADLLAGTPGANSTYLVYGTNQSPASISTSAMGTLGCQFFDSNTGSRFGTALSKIPDMNGDAIDEFICGAPRLKGPLDLVMGGAYIVFGQPSFPGLLDVASLNGTNGFCVTGTQDNAEFGAAVGYVDDFDGDNVPDGLIGAHQYDITAIATNDAGAAYFASFGKIAKSLLYRPEIISIENLGAINRIKWTAQLGKQYTVSTNAALVTGTWGDLGSLNAASPIITFDHPTSTERLHYRIRVE